MTTPGRAALSAVLIATLAGCAGAGGADPERPYEGLAFDLSVVPEELRVPRPKDMRGIPPCDLLTEAQLTEVGLRADTAEELTVISRGRGCSWQLVGDPNNYATAGGSTDLANPGLPGIYVVRETLARFEPLQIGGHPGVRTNLNHGSGCDITVAPSDDQLLGADGNLAGRPMPDECARSRRMIELILSNLPPRR